MAEAFKLPGTSYEIIQKIIKGYSTVKEGQTYSLADVAQSTGLDTSQISRNNNFLIELGIITSGGKKSPTEIGKKLGMALTHEVNDSQKIWRDIIEENEFLSKMITAIKIRGGMDRNSFVNHILYSAGNTSTAATAKAGANAIIDIFIDSGLLNEVDDKISFVHSTINEEVDNVSDDMIEDRRTISSVDMIIDSKKESSPQSNSAVVNINININVNSKDEYSLLGEELVKLIDNLNKMDEKDETI